METLITVGLVLLVIGIVLVGIEMIMPGFGVTGITGGISIIAGIVMMSDSVEGALKLSAIVIVILAILLALVILIFHSKKIKSPIILEKELNKDLDYISTKDLEYLIGKEGISSTILRPTGKCDIEGVSFEVRSENEYIDKGRKVKIIKIQNNMLVVKEC